MMQDPIDGMTHTYTKKGKMGFCADASPERKQEVSCGTVTVLTMEDIIMQAEPPQKFYSVGSGCQQFSKTVRSLSETVIAVKEQVI
ncbi:hypothetical protein A2U01_0073013, partial [Trifolium medium]|nr:hypothetical protein [Trifolium medium]